MLVGCKGMCYLCRLLLKKELSKEERLWGSNVEIKDNQPKINADVLAKEWNIELNRAIQTLEVTSQKGIRNARGSMARRLPSQPYRIKRIAPGK